MVQWEEMRLVQSGRVAGETRANKRVGWGVGGGNSAAAHQADAGGRPWAAFLKSRLTWIIKSGRGAAGQVDKQFISRY